MVTAGSLTFSKNKEQKIQEDENYVSSLQKIYKARRL